MTDWYKVRDTRREVRTMSDAECMTKYNRNREEYLSELNEQYNEWQDHFASMFE